MKEVEPQEKPAKKKITYSPWMRLILPMSGRKRKPLIRPLPTMISTEMCLAKMTVI